jgi:hypothetical protein
VQVYKVDTGSQSVARRSDTITHSTGEFLRGHEFAHLDTAVEWCFEQRFQRGQYRLQSCVDVSDRAVLPGIGVRIEISLIGRVRRWRG